jgi:hypothetical protein
MENLVIGRLTEIEEAKKSMTNRIDKFILADNLSPLNFVHKDKKGYIEYEKGLFIKNITDITQEILGMTILHAFTTNDIKINTHKHTAQAQHITIVKGKIFDLDSEKLYEINDSIFTVKNRNHKLKYFANSEYIIYYAPNLVQF